MKQKISILSSILLLFVSVSLFAQADKSKRPSPPDKVSATTKSGVAISVDYSQPSVKGRMIGKELAPYGKVWRTGANEATVFEISKDVKINGKTLVAGKYGLYSIPGETEWTFIFNKTWNQWGTNYTEADDALRITAKPYKTGDMMEKMTFKITANGDVDLYWGNMKVGFKVK